MKLALHEYGAETDNLVGLLVDNNEGVVCARKGAQDVEVIDPCRFAWIRGAGKDGKNGEVAASVVGRSQRADLSFQNKNVP